MSAPTRRDVSNKLEKISTVHTCSPLSWPMGHSDANAPRRLSLPDELIQKVNMCMKIINLVEFRCRLHRVRKIRRYMLSIRAINAL